MFKKFKTEKDCKHYRDLIEKRLNGEISPDENSELDEHLADCEACMDEFLSLAMVQDVLIEESENPVEVPDGFFEKMNAQLDDVKPALGWKGLLANPFMGTYRNVALGTASLVLVAVLTMSVGTGAIGRFSEPAQDLEMSNASSPRIMTNSGETIMLSGDEGDPDRYADAIDDLERAYREAQGLDSGDNSEGYIHTSWKDGESATPIR